MSLNEGIKKIQVLKAEVRKNAKEIIKDHSQRVTKDMENVLKELDLQEKGLVALQKATKNRSAKGVAEFLKKKGIKGTKQSPVACPLAQYFKAIGFDYASVDGDDIRLIADASANGSIADEGYSEALGYMENDVEFSSGTLDKFIQAFDDNKFPELKDSKHPEALYSGGW